MRLFLIASVLAVMTGVSSAQVGGDLQLDTFRPAMDSRGYFTVNASQTLGDKDVAFGLGALDWGHHLLAFGDQDGGSFFGSKCSANAGPCYSVDNIVTATLIGAFGLKLGPADLEFGASFPVVIMGGDRGPDIDTGNTNTDTKYTFSGQGLTSRRTSSRSAGRRTSASASWRASICRRWAARTTTGSARPAPAAR
jgi:hypothetical protein